MAIFKCEFDSLAKTFSVTKDGEAVPNVKHFSVCQYRDDPAYMSMEQTSTIKNGPEGIVQETRVWSSAEEQPADMKRFIGVSTAQRVTITGTQPAESSVGEIFRKGLDENMFIV